MPPIASAWLPRSLRRFIFVVGATRRRRCRLGRRGRPIWTIWGCATQGRVRGRVYADLLCTWTEHPGLPCLPQALEAIPIGQARAGICFELGMALESIGAREEAYRLVESAVRLSRRIQRRRDAARFDGSLADSYANC